MSKKKSKDFFRSSSLKLNREIKEERSKQAKENAKGGFIKELRNQDKTRHQLKQNKATADVNSYYKGEQVSPSSEPIEDPGLSVDPSREPMDSPEKGFQHEQNFHLSRKGVK